MVETIAPTNNQRNGNKAPLVTLLKRVETGIFGPQPSSALEDTPTPGDDTAQLMHVAYRELASSRRDSSGGIL